jgi:hypothetical protein
MAAPGMAAPPDIAAGSGGAIPIAAPAPPDADASAGAALAGAALAAESLAGSSPPPQPAVIRSVAGRNASTNNRRRSDGVAELTTEFSHRGPVFLADRLCLLSVNGRHPPFKPDSADNFESATECRTGAEYDKVFVLDVVDLAKDPFAAGPLARSTIRNLNLGKAREASSAHWHANSARDRVPVLPIRPGSPMRC